MRDSVTAIAKRLTRSDDEEDYIAAQEAGAATRGQVTGVYETEQTNVRLLPAVQSRVNESKFEVVATKPPAAKTSNGSKKKMKKVPLQGKMQAPVRKASDNVPINASTAPKPRPKTKPPLELMVDPPSHAYFYEYEQSSGFANCEDNCATFTSTTCGRCVTADFLTGSFAIHRALFVKGKPQIFGPTPRLKGTLKSCYLSCAKAQGDPKPMREGPPLGNFNGGYLQDFWVVNDFNFGGNSSVMHQQCAMFNRIGIVIQDHSMLALYHFVLERMFEVFVLVGSVSKAHGCPPHKVEVFIRKMMIDKVDAPYSTLWEAMLPRQDRNKLSGCFDAVYYGLPFKGSRLSPDYGRTPEFMYNSKRSIWASLFSLQARDAWNISHAVKKNEAMLVLYHHRMPDWLWKLSWGDVDGVHLVKEKLEGKSLGNQIRLVSRSRGIISAEGAAFTWQIFLSPRSALLQFSLTSDAMNPKRKNLLPERDKCSTTPGCCHDIWGAHLGHSVLTWRWCDKKPFSEVRNASESMASKAVKFLLEQNNLARRNSRTWICYILRSTPANSRDLQFTCDVEIVIPDRDIEHFRDDGHPKHAAEKCGAFGGAGPSLLERLPHHFIYPRTLRCVVTETCRRHQTPANWHKR